VQRADQIVVMDHGRIVERGDHATLLARSPAGLYRRLHDLQFSDAAAIVASDGAIAPHPDEATIEVGPRP
jgi:ABC-type antimicrobial peptide transport system ATPase subunit